MPDIDVAVERLLEACRAGEIVAVYGDYDVDGVTATTILVETLSRLGANPRPYLPHRFTEGYGPNKDAFERLRSEGATLLVTADCGTSAVEEVAYANELGDGRHRHRPPQPPDVLPDAVAIVNPKLKGDAYGRATARSRPPAASRTRSQHDLHERLGVPYEPEEHLALVALGTVCDLAPMIEREPDLSASASPPSRGRSAPACSRWRRRGHRPRGC